MRKNKKMKVKVSKTMVKTLNQELKEKGLRFDFVTMPENCYKFYVSYDILTNSDDYNYETEKFSVISVSYPNDYYACNNYLSSNDLRKCFLNSDRTYSGFIQSVYDEVAI